MGYVKQQHIDEMELEFFIESAKAGTIEEHYPSLEGTFETRNLPIGNDWKIQWTKQQTQPLMDWTMSALSKPHLLSKT